MNYSEQLKSPMWQKKRLEIMEKDNFTCQICGDNESTLNVHHLHYEKGKKVHEYEPKHLITLCENCHKEEHNLQISISKDVASFIGKRGLTMFELFAFIELIDVGMYCDNNYITKTFGNSSGQYGNYDLKNLEYRRNKL